MEIELSGNIEMGGTNPSKNRKEELLAQVHTAPKSNDYPALVNLTDNLREYVSADKELAKGALDVARRLSGHNDYLQPALDAAEMVAYNQSGDEKLSKEAGKILRAAVKALPSTAAKYEAVEPYFTTSSFCYHRTFWDQVAKATFDVVPQLPAAEKERAKDAAHSMSEPSPVRSWLARASERRENNFDL